MSGPYRVAHRFLANARACSTNSRAAGESAVRDRHARPIVRLAAGSNCSTWHPALAAPSLNISSGISASPCPQATIAIMLWSSTM